MHSDFEELQNYVESKVTSNTEFTIPLTNVTFVRKFLTSLNVKKSTGIDNMGPRVFTTEANVLASSLTFIVNKSYSLVNFHVRGRKQKFNPFLNPVQKMM